MEQRIKIIWILSLLSMLLIVAGQGYWLWNQCQYKNEELMKEMHARVLEAVALNDSARSLQPKKIFTDSASVSWGAHIAFVSNNDSAMGKVRKLYTYKQKVVVKLTEMIKEALADTSLLYADSISFRSKEQVEWGMGEEIRKYMLQVDVPFTLQRFDSVLAVKLPGISFETSFCSPRDSLFTTKDTVALKGSRRHPVVEVVYPYNPFGWQQVRILVRPPLQTLLLRMGWQLVGSVSLILLLALCLLLQIKTILKQRRIDELRQSFVNTMIHELKRPVQALKMCVAFLNDKVMRTDEQAMDGVVHDAVSELDNLSAYLRKLCDMTRADDNKTQLSLSTFDLSPMVDKLIRLQHIPPGKQVSFETRFTAPLTVTADPVHLANIVSNLIENAVKYSGSSVHIAVEGALHGGFLTLKVIDDGIGIPAAEQGKVFDKFYRGSNLPDCSLPGIGLGLSYVKLLVEAHRGTVSLKSRPGKGTTAEITIPQ